MTRATAVDRAKKITSMRRPLHASTTPISVSLSRITFPSEIAGTPSVWSRKVLHDVASSLQRTGQGRSENRWGSGYHEGQKGDRRPRPAAGRASADHQAQAGQGRHQRNTVMPFILVASAEEPQADAHRKQNRPPPGRLQRKRRPQRATKPHSATAKPGTR